MELARARADDELDPEQLRALGFGAGDQLQQCAGGELALATVGLTDGRQTDPCGGRGVVRTCVGG
jgi:hypothetical protein